MSRTSWLVGRTWPKWNISGSSSMALDIVDEDKWSLSRRNHHVTPSPEEGTFHVNTGHTSTLLMSVVAYYVAVAWDVVSRVNESSWDKELTCPSVPDSLDVLESICVDQAAWVKLGLPHCGV